MPHPEIAALRLRAHRVTAKLDTLAEVVRHMGALQAQDYTASLWAIGVRTKASTANDIALAVERREIARTWPMRGTLHWVPAADLRWMVDLMAPRAMAKAAARTRQLEIDARVASKARKLLERRLNDGPPLTRAEAYALFAESGIEPEGQRGIHLLQLLSHEGVLCFGPHRGKQPTFVLADSWLPKAKPRAREEARSELASRYFLSHGPATVRDFAWWTGLTLADAREGLDAVRNRVESMVVEGTEYWFDPALPAVRETGLQLLPGFDEFILGYTDRTAVLSPEQQKRLIPGKNGMFLSSMVTPTGTIIGTWSRLTKKDRVVLEAESFDGGPVPAGFHDAARRYAEFLGMTLDQ